MEERMTLLSNLIVAEQAAKYANDLLRGRSSNRPEDIAHTMLENLNNRFANMDPEGRRERMTHELTAFNIGMRTQEIHMQRWPAIRDAREARNNQGNRLSSAAIIADGICNCFEHAVLAAHYLNGRNVASYLVDTDDNTNHCFVVIGAPGGLGGQTINVTQFAPGVLNGGFTVVCDPWYHEWIGVQQEWGRKMWHIFGQTTKNPPMPNPVPLTFTNGALVT
jgi:hypothetical protein